MTSQSVAGSRRVSFAERIYDISSSVSTTSEKKRLSCIDLKNSDSGMRNNSFEYNGVGDLTLFFTWNNVRTAYIIHKAARLDHKVGR